MAQRRDEIDWECLRMDKNSGGSAQLHQPERLKACRKWF